MPTVFGPLSLVIGIAVSIACYLRQRGTDTAVPADSAPRHFGIAMFVALAGWLLGTAAGVTVACSSAAAGNLCGLQGYLGTGPLLAGLGLVAHAYWVTARRRRP